MQEKFQKQNIRIQKQPMPEEFNHEFYERRYFSAIFDRLDLVIAFQPGKDNIGAVVKSWVDGIKAHDFIVKKVEEKMDEVHHLKHVYEKNNRIFKNWSAGWTALNIHPEDYDEYLDILPRMENFEERLKLMDDPDTIIKAKVDFKRFKELEPINARLHDAQKALEKSLQLRDLSRDNLVKGEGELSTIREEEKKAASEICDDHIIADEKHVFIGEIFPEIHEGYILCSINDDDVEELLYDDIMKKLKKRQSSCTAYFRRYDYRLNRLTNEWISLEELRKLNMYTEDPRLPRADFVRMASVGDKVGIEAALRRGEDPNAYDYSGVTALHAAVVNRHEDIVRLLVDVGAVVNTRDKNLMSPLLACARRGFTDMIKLLISLDADVHISDRLMRNAIYYAASSGNPDALEVLLQLPAQLITFDNTSNAEGSVIKGGIGRDLDPEIWTVNQADRTWGWTPLHMAANKGSVILVKMLLDANASIYRLSKTGKTAEQVAEETGHIDAFLLLRDVRLKAPAQRAYRTTTSAEAEVWLGDVTALHPGFIMDAGITHVLQFKPPKLLALPPPRCLSPTSSTDSFEDDNNNNLEGVEEEDGVLDKKDIEKFMNSHLKGLSVHKPTSRMEQRPDMSITNSSLKTSKIPYVADGLIQLDIEVDMKDDDITAKSWVEFRSNIITIVDFLTESLLVKGAKILICDVTGVVSPAAALCVYQILRFQTRLSTAIRTCVEVRPVVKLSTSLQKGLELLQEEQDKKRLNRLRNKVRNAPALSCAF